jgi:peptide deformylase
MILPIHVYGDAVLRTKTVVVSANTEEIQNLIDDMIATMRSAEGVGLAAPQIGRKERIFVADVTPMYDDPEEIASELPPQPMIFINPEIIWESEEESEIEEGCLSIPDIRELVIRPERIRLRFQDREFISRELEVGDVMARVIQHEYDHLDGILFVDHISAFRRRLLRRRLRDMARGDVEADYPLHTASPA